MGQNVTAEIIAIGTEILLGEITDTNSVFIAQQLRDVGINLYFMTSVGDNEQRIVSAIQLALGRADIVITCGGLGPTVDDMTRQAVATATDRGLTFHQPLLDAIAERFAGFKMNMTENNKRQAYTPDNSIIIENPVGTAPSFAVPHQGKLVVSVPGVPREMKYLMTERVIPLLRSHFGLSEEVIKARVLKTAGIGESILDDQIGNELLSASNPTVGLAAHSGQVDVRITAKANSQAEADVMIAEVEKVLREKVGAYIFGVDSDTIEEAFLRALERQGLAVGIVEAGLKGAISDRVRSAGPQLAFHVQHLDSPEELIPLLDGGDMNVPLRQTAEQAAAFAYRMSPNGVGIAVVSRPDMDEHHNDTEQGTAIAVMINDQVRSRAYGFGARSDVARQWAGTWALSMAWRMLTEKEHYAS